MFGRHTESAVLFTIDVWKFVQGLSFYKDLQRKGIGTRWKTGKRMKNCLTMMFIYSGLCRAFPSRTNVKPWVYLNRKSLLSRSWRCLNLSATLVSAFCLLKYTLSKPFKYRTQNLHNTYQFYFSLHFVFL